MSRLKAEIIVLQITDDLQHRNELGDMWFAMDNETREKIKQDWIKMTEEELRRTK